MTGEHIKELIRRNNFTQSQIAREIGESPQNFGSLLNASDVKSSLVERISSAIGMSISEMYGEVHTQASRGDPRLLSLLEEKDRQISRLQEQVSKLIDVLADRK